MDAITAIDTIRDSLRTNLTDPYTLAGASDRGGSTWIYGDEPHTAYKYPQIEIKKVDNPSTVISIGPEYAEREFVYMNIWFYSKNGFTGTIDTTERKNSALVEYYLGLIKTTLKAQFSTLFTAGVKGYTHLNTTTVAYDPTTQLYFGAVTIKVEFFQGCS